MLNYNNIYNNIVMDLQKPDLNKQQLQPADHRANIVKNENQTKLQQIIRELAQSQLELSQVEIQNLLQDPLVDRLLGCMFGAFIGDSLGSYCEFQNKATAEKLVIEAMEMPGGGVFNLKAGQITDDSEMALHLLQALLIYDSKTSLQKQTSLILITIAKQYVKWYYSQPFDIGNTCRQAISKLEHYFSKQINKNQYSKQEIMKSFQNLLKAQQQISKINGESLSNGFLMRITPMVCFYTLIAIYKTADLENIQKFLDRQANMTHGNQLCFDANREFIILLSKLISRQSHQSISAILKSYEDKCQKASSKQTSVFSFIREGFNTEKSKGQLMTATIHEGFFKIAYVYSFYFFKHIADRCKSEEELNSEIYKEAMMRTIREGGDTDTNACIVGGLVGSLVGFKKLPTEYLVKQLSLKLDNDNHRGLKAKFYEPRRGFINLIKLIRKFR